MAINIRVSHETPGDPMGIRVKAIPPQRMLHADRTKPNIRMRD